VFLAALLSVVAAIAALAAARGLDTGDRSGASAATGTHPALPLLIAAAVSGFGTLALEVIFTRLLVNVTDSSAFSFALVLSSFLVSLALGAALPGWLHRFVSPLSLAAAAATSGAIAILSSPALCAWAWSQPRAAPPDRRDMLAAVFALLRLAF